MAWCAGRAMKCAAACGTFLLFATMRVDAQPTFRSNVDAVRLDVSVMRRDQPVVGLTAKDFTALDNGARLSRPRAPPRARSSRVP